MFLLYFYLFVHFPHLFVIYLFNLNFTFTHLSIPLYTLLHTYLLLSLQGARGPQEYPPSLAFQVSASLGISLLLRSEKAAMLGE